MRNRIKKSTNTKRKFLHLAAGALVLGTIIPASVQISISLKEQAFLKAQNELLQNYLNQNNQAQAPSDESPLKADPRAASFDVETWWNAYPEAPTSWDLINDPNILFPPEALNLSDFLDSNLPYYDVRNDYGITNWIQENQANAINEGDFITIYQNGSPIVNDGSKDAGLKIDHNSDFVTFDFSTPNLWKENKKHQVTITWPKSFNEKAAQDYIDLLTSRLPSDGKFLISSNTSKISDSNPYTLGIFIKYLNEGINPGKDPLAISPATLPDELKFLNPNGSVASNGIQIPLNQDFVDFKLQFPKYTYVDGKMEYWTKDIHIQWTNSSYDDLATDLWAKAETFIVSSPADDESQWRSGAPQSSYTISDLKELLNLPSPSVNGGLTGNYILLDPNDDTISASTSLDVENNEQELSFRIAFPKNGTDTPITSTTIADYNVTNEVITLRWKENRFQVSATKDWDEAQDKMNVYLKENPEVPIIPGTAPESLTIGYILGQMNLTQPYLEPAVFTFGYKTSEGGAITWVDQANSYTLPVDASDFTFYLRLSKLDNKGEYNVSEPLILKWEESRQATSVREWWIQLDSHLNDDDNVAVDIIVDETNQVPTELTLNDLTNASKKNIFDTTWFATWMTKQPKLKDGNPLAKLKLFYDGSEITNGQSIPLYAEDDKVIIKLQYPETGDWSTSDPAKVLEKQFLITWTKSRNVYAADKYWASLNSILVNKTFGLSKLPEQTYYFANENESMSIKNILGIIDPSFDPSYINTDLSMDKWELWQDGKKVDSVSVDGDKSTLTFTLKYPTNGKSATLEADYFAKDITFTWKRTRDQQKVIDWLAKMPANGSIDMGPDSVAPENISINDFIDENGLFAKYEFNNNTDGEPKSIYDWYQEKPKPEKPVDSSFDDLRLYNRDNWVEGVLTIDAWDSDITINLKYPDTGYWNTKESETTYTLTITWNKSVNEDLAEKYWDQIKTNIEKEKEGKDFTVDSGRTDPTIGFYVGSLKKGGEAWANYTFDDIKSDFDIPVPPKDSILENKLSMYEVLGNIAPTIKITIDDQTKNITFELRLPKNGISGANDIDFYRYQIAVSWDFTHDEQDIKEWFEGYEDTEGNIHPGWEQNYAPLNPSYESLQDGKTYTHVPDDVLVSDLASFLGAAPSWFTSNELKVYDQNGAELEGSDTFSPTKTKNNFTLTFKVAQDGHWDLDGQGKLDPKELIYEKTITFNYDQSNDTHYAQAYYESLAAISGGNSDGTYEGGSPLGNKIDINKLKSYNLIDHISDTDLLGTLLFVDQAGNLINDGTFVTMTDYEFELEFWLAFPKDGKDPIGPYDKDNYWFNPSQKFTFTWTKTVIEGNVWEWFNNGIQVKNPNTLNPPQFQPNEQYNISEFIDEINGLLDLDLLNRPDQTDLNFYVQDDDGNWTKVTDHYQVGPNADSLTIRIGVNSWDVDRTEIFRDLTINWTSSRNDKIVEDWLGEKDEPITLPGFPNPNISYEEVEALLFGEGENHFPPILGDISGIDFKNILILEKQEDTASFVNMSIGQDESTITFYLKYYKNGFEDEATVTEHPLQITWDQSRQAYLDDLASAILNGESVGQSSDNTIGNDFGQDKAGNQLNHYTNNGATFGYASTTNKKIIQAFIDTNRNPWSDEEASNFISAQDGGTTVSFASQIDELQIKILSFERQPLPITNLDPDSPLAPLVFYRYALVKLELSFLGATKEVSIQIDFNQADIQNILDTEANFANQWNQIEISGNTNEPKIHIPEAVINYFNNLFLTPTLVIDKLGWTNPEEFIISDESPYWEFDEVKKEYVLDLQKHSLDFLDNDNNNNDLIFKLKVDLDPAFTDPANKIDDLASAVSLEKHFDIFINTDDFELWKTDSASDQALVGFDTSVNTNNWSLKELLATPHYYIQYRFDYDDDSKTDTEWEDLPSFNARHLPLWDQFLSAPDGTNGGYLGKVQIRLQPDRNASDTLGTAISNGVPYQGDVDSNYVVSSTRDDFMPKEMANSLNKVINFGNILMQLKNEFSNVFNQAHHTYDLDWTINGIYDNTKSAQENIANLLSKNHLQIEYAIETNSSDSPIWLSGLPNYLNYLVDVRHFIIRVTVDSGFELNGDDTWDLAKDDSEKIDRIDQMIGYIEAPDIENHTIVGNTYYDNEKSTSNAAITLDDLQEGLKYEYSLDNGNNWLTETEFKQKMYEPSNDYGINLIKANFKFRIVVTDETKYIIGKNKNTTVNTEKNFDVSNLKTYIDIEHFASILNAGFAFNGKFGVSSDEKNPNLIELKDLNPELAITNLAKFRLKLQYQLSQTSDAKIPNTWIDLPSEVRVDSEGHKYITLDTNLIPGQTKPIIKFRVVPYLKDGQTEASIDLPDANSTISEFEDHSTVQLSSPFVSKGYTINLPTIVTTDEIYSEYFSYASDDPSSTNTHNLKLEVNTSSNQAIKNANGGIDDLDYWNNIVYAFSIDDGKDPKINHDSSRFAFEPADFAKWLRGDFVVGDLPQVWIIKDEVGSNLDPLNMIYDTLPEAYRTPNWNDLDMNSLTVQWVTKTTNNVALKLDPAQQEAYNYYIPSNSDQFNLASTFKDQVAKWFDVSGIFNEVNSTYITGDSHLYEVDANNKIKGAAKDLEAKINNLYLNKYGLKREFSNDKINWSEDLPKYNTWALKTEAKLYMRIIQISDSSDGNYHDYSLYLVYPGSEQYAAFDTTTWDKGNSTGINKDFKIYVEPEKDILTNVKITGNQYTLDELGNDNDQQGIDESLANSNTEDYSVLTIEYLYNGVYYDKAGLAGAIKANRESASVLGDLAFPKDFEYNNVSVRWKLTGDPNKYVLSLDEVSAEDNTISIDYQANASELKNFNNLWGLLNKEILTYTSEDNQSTDYVDFRLDDLYALSGTFNSAKLEMLNQLTNQYLLDHEIKIQYSTKENPSPSLSDSNKDWIDATLSGSSSSIVFDGLSTISNLHKSLYIRFVSTNHHATTSVVTNGGNGENAWPIRLDASGMKFGINVDSNVLKTLAFEENTTTQDLRANTDAFFDGEKSQISYQDGAIETWIKDLADPVQWMVDNGLTIRFKIKQTRKKPIIITEITYENGIKKEVQVEYNFGDDIIFNSLADLQIALQDKTNKLNFTHDNLWISWGILPKMQETNFVIERSLNDNPWVKPDNYQSIVNIIYAKDNLTLDEESVKLSNNNLKVITSVKAEVTNNLPEGIKLQYSLDGINGWQDTPFVNITATNKVFVRLAPINGYYQLADDVETEVNKINQTTQLSTKYVQTAIILADSPEGWENIFNNMSITGDAIPSSSGDFNIINEVKIGLATDGWSVGHWEYTLDQEIDDSTKWFRSLLEAVPEYKDSGIKSFDHDREDHYTLRYVLDNEDQPKPVDGTIFEGGYVFTDEDGDEISYLQREVSIESLTQYLYFDYQDPNLPTISKESSEHMSWRDMANKGTFLPKFNVPGSGEGANYEAMQYNGSHLTKDGFSLYKFDVNPYSKPGTAPDLTRSPDNGLAPRHTHFEYRYQGRAWTTDLADLKNLPLESNNFPFEVRIVPDEAIYKIPTEGEFGDQSWSRTFQVVIVRETNSIAAESAQYVGFEDPSSPTGRFLTDDPTNEGDPQLSISKEDDGGNRFIWDDFKSNDEAFVLEYQVWSSKEVDGKKQKDKLISWKDSDGHTQEGWNAYPSAPGLNTPWKGNVPVSLKNGDIVEVRLRAKNGYVILDENSDYDPSVEGKPNTGFAPYSSVVTFEPVIGLVEALEVPDNFQIYDGIHNVDFAGNDFDRPDGDNDGIFDDNMPTWTFSGADGSGKINIDYGNLANFSSHINFKVQVLRPIANTETFVNPNMVPLDGYYLLDNNKKEITKENGTKLEVMTVERSGSDITNWTFSWENNIDDIANTWVNPNDVDYLQVGDAIRIRIEAKPGYGFAWEDEKIAGDDIVVQPKTHAQYAYNTNGLLADNKDYNKAVLNTPIPVTGLTITPSIFPSAVLLKYSSDPTYLLEGHAKIGVTYDVEANAKWKFSFRVQKIGEDGKPYWTPRDDKILEDIYNGDVVEISITNKPGYALDKDYTDNPQSAPNLITVTGLKKQIDSNDMPRPLVSFSGYEGKGTIGDLVSNNPEKPFSSEKDDNGFNTPIVYTGYQGNGVKWQFQTAYGINPYESKELTINNLQWEDNPPDKLRIGDYVRVRVAAKPKPKEEDPDSETKALLSEEEETDIVFPFVYSKPSDDIDDSKLPDYQKGWVKVSNLKVNIDNAKIYASINGYIGETSINSSVEIGDKANTFDEEAVVVEFRSADSTRNRNTWTDLPNDKNNDGYGLIDLTNESTFSMRLKTKEGFIFEEDSLPEGMSITHDSKTNVYYLENTAWTNLPISGLQTFLNVGDTEIGNITDDPKDEQWLNNFESMLDPEKAEGLVDGFVQLAEPKILDKETIRDREDKTVDKGNIPYSEYVEIHYIVQRINPNTGKPSEPEEQDTIPTNLSNGDIVIVELKSNNPEYKLSSTKSVRIVVSGLQEIAVDVDLPQLKFVGANNEGGVVVQNPAPKKKSYQYAYVKAGQEIPADDAIEWLDESPSNLSNSDKVRVRLVSTLSGEQVLQQIDPEDPSAGFYPIISEWTEVTGLKTKIDLSTLVIDIFNELNPYNPNQDLVDWQFPFKLEGVQSGYASVEIAAPLWSEDVHHMLHDQNGQVIENGDKLVWEFAVNNNPNGLEAKSWSKALPQNLDSGQYVHARLAIKDGALDFSLDPDNLVWTFQVPELKNEESVDTKTILLVSFIAGGAVVLGTIATTTYILISRKKNSLNTKTKM